MTSSRKKGWHTCCIEIWRIQCKDTRSHEDRSNTNVLRSMLFIRHCFLLCVTMEISAFCCLPICVHLTVSDLHSSKNMRCSPMAESEVFKSPGPNHHVARIAIRKRLDHPAKPKPLDGPHAIPRWTRQISTMNTRCHLVDLQ